MKNLIALLLALAPVSAFARTPYEDLIQLRQQVRASCRAVCTNGYAIQVAYQDGKGALNPAFVAKMQRTANDQAQIWGDTILEGDYEMTTQVRLDEISVITRAGTVVGYRITYSSGARSPWGVGRIRETSWVHTDLTTGLVEENEQATFVLR